MAIDHISDTARWVAVYRAMESERPDALFHDPFARRLAGAQGEEIVAAMKQGRAVAWAMIVRTAVFDEIILDTVRSQRVDLVVNLAAGLDARPWRLALPASLRWVDVDLPAILDYKREMLADAAAVCAYDAIPADLTDVGVREALFARLGADSRRALVVTEGTAFFSPFGWRESQFRSSMEEAQRLHREMRTAWLWRFVARLSPERRRDEFRRMSGIVLLERE